MPRFCANLSFLWPELEPLERFAAAARAGFEEVEYLFPQELPAAGVAGALADNGLRLVLFDAWPGDRDSGERGCLAIPGREAELRRSVDHALELAARFGTRLINVLGGVLPEGLDRAAARGTAIANLLELAPRAGASGVTLLLENLNIHDAPGYVFPTVDAAADVVAAVDHGAVGLQFDFYHVCRAGQEPGELFQRYAHLVRHVQLADTKGRHQPGTGGAPVEDFLRTLDSRGYNGGVGLEYHPLGSTEESLAWLAGWGRPGASARS